MGLVVPELGKRQGDAADAVLAQELGGTLSFEVYDLTSLLNLRYDENVVFVQSQVRKRK